MLKNKGRTIAVKRKILILGGSYMNLQMKMDPRTKENNITLGSEYRFHPFGEAALTAITASKLGGECLFGTKFGDDTNGKRLYEYYKGCGIKTDLMRKDKSLQTGMSITLYSDLETHEIYLSKGASAHFTKEEIDDAFITMPDMFLVPPEELGCEERIGVMKMGNASADSSSEEVDSAAAPSSQSETLSDHKEKTESDVSSDTPEMPRISTYRYEESLAYYAIQKAEERQVDLIMRYTPFTAKFPIEKIENIKILVISDDMLYSLTGFFPNTTDKALRSLVALSQKVKAKYYVVEQGDDTAFVYDGRYYESVSAPVRLRSVTKNDGKKMNPTFVGALAAEYLESKNIVRACHFALIVSLMTRSKFGSLEKVPTKAELEAYAAENGMDLYQG